MEEFSAICGGNKTIEEISNYIHDNSIDRAALESRMEEIMTAIIAAERLDVAKWLIEYFDIKEVDDLCFMICTCESKDIAVWFYEKFKWCTHYVSSTLPVSFHDAFPSAANQLAAARLQEYFGISKEDIRASLYVILHKLCAENKLGYAKGMHEDVRFTNSEVTQNDSFILKDTIGRGHLPIVEWLLTTFNFDDRQVQIQSIIVACNNGRTEICRLLQDKFLFTYEEVTSIGGDILSIVCRRGFLENAKWLVDQFNIPERVVRMGRNDIFRRVCNAEHFEIAKWLLTRFGRGTRDDQLDYFEAFRYACVFGNLRVVRWLDNELKFTRSLIVAVNCDSFRWACRTGRLDIVQWMVDRYKLTNAEIAVNDHDALKWACRNEHMNVAQWLVDRFALIPDNAGEYRDLLRFGAATTTAATTKE
jgi:hypothetical protein